MATVLMAVLGLVLSTSCISSSSGTDTASTAAAARVANPYAGVTGYVNPEWKAKADAESGGSQVSNNPTGVWLDRIAAIAGSSTSMGLAAHLDAAVAQGAGYIQVVIYDLPGRDCAALASNGELGPTEIGRYKTEFIDPIAAIMADSKYANLRIINIIEIDSLPNLVTNAGSQSGATSACATMLANGNYVTGIQYALSKLGALPNVYNYIDAGHHAWLGWDSNFGPAADLFASTAKGAVGGVDTVAGFITNTANYSSTVEPYFTINTTVNGTSVRQSKWVDWNYYVDEQSFATAFRDALVSRGFNSTIGMLIDTSRNGWGGSARPTAASTSTNVDTFVDDSRIDRRIHAGNWCNQSGAGLGERPQVVGSNGIHAYVWIKPPGESDGSSTAIANDEGKGFDQMCDPTYTGNARNGNNLTGALANAPLSGHWFSAQFQQLMANAYPPLSGGGGTGTCTTAPAAPTSLTATATSSSQINLTWSAVTAPTNCSVTYSVYRSTTSGFTPSSSNLVTSGLTTASYSNTGLTASTTYYYVVRAVDAAGSSASSTQASATTQAGSSGTTPCANAITWTGQTGNFNTTGAVCYKTNATISGWGCSSFDGRTVSVNNVTVTCGASLSSVAKWSDGYYYFSVSAGTYSWASMYYW